MSTGGVNLQDSFLNQARKESALVEVMLLGGPTLQGVVRGFDSFTVVFQVGDKQHLVYKHAIAQVVSDRFTRMPAPADKAALQQQRSGDGSRRRDANQAPAHQPRPAREPAPQSQPEPFNRIDLSNVRLASAPDASTAPSATQPSVPPSDSAAADTLPA